MKYSIEVLEIRLSYLTHHLKTVVTKEMKKEYIEQKEDIELAIHNLKMLKSIKPPKNLDEIIQSI